MTNEETQQIVKFILFFLAVLLIFLAFFLLKYELENPPEFTTKNERAEIFCESQEMILVDLWVNLNKGTCGVVDDISIKEKRFIDYVEGINDWRFREL